MGWCWMRTMMHCRTAMAVIEAPTGGAAGITDNRGAAIRAAERAAKTGAAAGMKEGSGTTESASTGGTEASIAGRMTEIGGTLRIAAETGMMIGNGITRQIQGGTGMQVIAVIGLFSSRCLF